MTDKGILLVAQYAGQGDNLFYMNSIGYWVAIFGIGLLLIAGIVIIILDSITEKEPEIWKEVHYDYRGMGEERSRDRDEQRTQGSK
jgi:vacuolar-type H+-ATPase subunit I/STV1